MKDPAGGGPPAPRRRVGNPPQVGNLPHMVFHECPRHILWVTHDHEKRLPLEHRNQAPAADPFLISMPAMPSMNVTMAE